VVNTQKNVSESLEIVVKTDPGMVRGHNEDAVLANPNLGLVILADGMGGYNAGEVASGMATTLLATELESAFATTPPHAIDQTSGKSYAHVYLRDKIAVTNRAIHHASESQAQYSGMGTTLVAALFHSDQVTVAHIGDSRLYRLRGGELSVITRDHSLLQQLVEERGMSPDEAARQPGAHALTRAIGAAEELQLDILELESLPGDVFLLCSDGLYQDLDHDLLTAALLRPSPQLALQRLFELALLGPARDNLSGVVINR
jgi:serine/threonine protein phosphatase PrpC